MLDLDACVVYDEAEQEDPLHQMLVPKNLGISPWSPRPTRLCAN